MTSIKKIQPYPFLISLFINNLWSQSQVLKITPVGCLVQDDHIKNLWVGSKIKGKIQIPTEVTVYDVDLKVIKTYDQVLEQSQKELKKNYFFELHFTSPPLSLSIEIDRFIKKIGQK